MISDVPCWISASFQPDSILNYTELTYYNFCINSGHNFFQKEFSYQIIQIQLANCQLNLFSTGIFRHGGTWYETYCYNN